MKLQGLKEFSELCFGLVFVLGCGAGSHGFRVSDLGWAVSAERPIIHAPSPKPQSLSPNPRTLNPKASAPHPRPQTLSS